MPSFCGKDLAPRLRIIPEDRAEIGHVAVLHMPSDLVDSISNVRTLRVADSCAYLPFSPEGSNWTTLFRGSDKANRATQSSPIGVQLVKG
jgi:hypothetical protein